MQVLIDKLMTRKAEDQNRIVLNEKTAAKYVDGSSIIMGKKKGEVDMTAWS